MAQSARSTVLFFPGAFADPSCFDSLSAHIRKLGYPTIYVRYPSLNPVDPTTVSVAGDAGVTRDKVLIPLLEAGKNVVIFAHSYGGIVGGAVAAGLSKAARSKEGMSGGVVGLVYLAGNIVGEGESLKDAIGGAYPPFIKENQPSQGLSVIDPAMSTLYNDISDAALAPLLEAGMIPHALNAFETPSTKPGWAEPEFDGRRVYIRTLKDQCNPLFIQDAWIEKTGVSWETVEMDTGYCPFIGCPEQVAKVVNELVEKWD